MKEKKTCPNCEREFEGTRKYCCYRCSVTAIVEANKQLKEKKGPIYERWKKGLAKAIERL